jgi:hypothetical protein
MAEKLIVRHYRFYDGRMACGEKSLRIDATSVEKAVTCSKCLKQLAYLNKLEEKWSGRTLSTQRSYGAGKVR